jgi:hypothetical protein
MKTTVKRCGLTFQSRATLLIIASALGVPQLASAVQLNVHVATIQQWGTGSGFYLGHTVLASSDFNLLTAGGTYTAQCNHSATLPVTCERTLSRSTAGVGKNVLTVTIPVQQPAIRNMSGWMQIPPETLLSCNYRWTASATESGYSISAGGIGIQFGNGSARDGGTTDFTMYRMARAEDRGVGCVP